MTSLRETLASRCMSRARIDRAADEAAADPELFGELLALLDDGETAVAWHAAWALEKVAARSPELFAERRAAITARAMTERHSGIQRLLLSIVRHLPDEEEPDVDLLDFCLDGIFSPKLSVASRSLCGKIAYSLCRRHAELQAELRACMENADDECLPTAVASVRRNILKKLNR